MSPLPPPAGNPYASALDGSERWLLDCLDIRDHCLAPSHRDTFMPCASRTPQWTCCGHRPGLLPGHHPKGGGDMELFADLAKSLFAPALIAAVGEIVLRLLPLVSNSVNDRAVRLAKAKNQQSE